MGEGEHREEAADELRRRHGRAEAERAAAGGLGNAESLAGWTLDFRTPIRNQAHLVKEGNSIVLDVQRRGLSIVVR